MPLFRRCIDSGEPLPVTDDRMTRFWITLQQAVSFVVESFESMNGGELFVPRIPSVRLVDLVDAIAPGYPTVAMGIRPGEKMHEEMISPDDGYRTLRRTDRYVVTPTIAEWGFIAVDGDPVPEGFSYRSDTNDWWLSRTELQGIIAQL